MTDYIIDNDVIVLGFIRGKYFHLAVTKAGLDKIPDAYEISKPHRVTGMLDVFVKATKPNMVALVLGGYITRGDANKCLGVTK